MNSGIYFVLCCVCACVGARILLVFFLFFFLYFFGFCAVSGNLEAPLHHLWPFGSLQTTPGLPDDHLWPNHGSKTIVRAFGFSGFRVLEL